MRRTKEGKMNKSLNEKLAEYGLTSSQINNLLMILWDLKEVEDLKYIKEEDLRHPNVRLGPIAARKLVEKISEEKSTNKQVDIGPHGMKLVKLLTSLFSQSELTRWWRYSMRQSVDDLITTQITMSDFTIQIVEKATDRNLLAGEKFWKMLRKEREYKVDKIDKVAALYGH